VAREFHAMRAASRREGHGAKWLRMNELLPFPARRCPAFVYDQGVHAAGGAAQDGRQGHSQHGARPASQDIVRFPSPPRFLQFFCTPPPRQRHPMWRVRHYMAARNIIA
jgi:hypothetical protein